MAVYSIIKKSKLESAQRIDAEYYQPEYFIDFTKGSWRPIGDFASVCQYGISQAMNDSKVGYPIFKMDDIEHSFLFDDNVKYADISKDVVKSFELAKNDVLFNRVNSEEFVGRTGIFKLDMRAVFASYLIRLRTKQQASADYLNIFLNSSFGIKQIRKFRRRAVNQANVNAEELKQIKIAILPIDFQKKIQSLSDESWRNFEKSKLFYSQAEDLLLQELGLKDFKSEEQLSCEVNLGDIKLANRMDADYFQPKYRAIIEKIKKHKLKVLTELVTMKKGFEPGSDEYCKEGKAFIRVSNISKFGFTEKDTKYLSNEIYQLLRGSFEPQKGDILLTKDATPGIASVLKEPVEGIIASGIMRLKIREDIDAEYLTLCINSPVCQMQVERDAGGSIIIHWKPEQIKNLLIPILPKPSQQKIADLVRKSHETRKKAKELLEEAKQKVEEMIDG